MVLLYAIYLLSNFESGHFQSPKKHVEAMQVFHIPKLLLYAG